jgi:hypothetical protein
MELDNSFSVCFADASGRVSIRKGIASRVPLYLTLGSPLAVRAVRNQIGPAFMRPSPVSRWVNGVDVNDAVTLGRALTSKTFGVKDADIENIGDVSNGSDDPHNIWMYLRDSNIARALVQTAPQAVQAG